MALYRILHRTFSTSTSAQPNSATTIKSISSDLFKERNLKRLVDNFKKSSEQYRFRTKTGIYENTVRRLASANRFRWIEEILEDQKKYIESSKEGFAARIITLYGRSGLFENARKVFDEIPESKRSVLSFNALLSACVHSKKFDMVDGYFREMPKKLSIEPDLVSYNTIIKAFCEMGSLDSAVSVIDEMEKKGLEPDLVSFNTLLNGLYRNGRFSDAEKIWGLMEKKNIVPDIRTYNAKLLGLASENKTKEAINLTGEMRTKGIAPDVYSFNSVIQAFINEGNLEGAKQWYGEIRKNDCAPDKVTYEILVPFVCKKGDLDFASRLSEEIFNRRFLLDAAILQLVIDELVKTSKIEEAKKLVELGKNNSHRKYKLKLPSDG